MGRPRSRLGVEKGRGRPAPTEKVLLRLTLTLTLTLTQVLLRLSSYFGGLLCVAWSHDDRLLFTGGEDDLVSRLGVRG